MVFGENPSSTPAKTLEEVIAEEERNRQIRAKALRFAGDKFRESRDLALKEMGYTPQQLEDLLATDKMSVLLRADAEEYHPDAIIVPANVKSAIRKEVSGNFRVETAIIGPSVVILSVVTEEQVTQQIGLDIAHGTIQRITMKSDGAVLLPPHDLPVKALRDLPLLPCHVQRAPRAKVVLSRA